ncbi:hypothetical protein, partial [Alteromonas sp. 14N.309.X.WAT.G.H12]|uniref:hypothetical protein n=1 Tax=Alteromonas sp. 14N.309.X.WAT.G.H12 TaxID=3120824 RepID=UPI002FCF3B66
MTIKVIVHCGGPKNGAAALRRWFKQNVSLLEQVGVYYPADENTHDAGNAGQILDIRADNSATFSKKKYQALLEQAETVKAKQVLLSSELFSSHLPSLVTNANNVQIISYVAIPSYQYESDYRYLVKEGLTAEKLMLDNRELAFHINTLRSQIESIGASHFILRAYHKNCFYRQDLLSDFLLALGITDVITTPLNLCDEVLANDALELKRWFNQFDTGLIQSELEQFLDFYSHNARPYT